MAFSMFDLYSLPPIRNLNVRGPYEYSKHKKTLSSTPSDSFRVPATPLPAVPADCPFPPSTQLGPYQQLSRATGHGSTIQVVRRKELPPVQAVAIMHQPALQHLPRRQSKAFTRNLKFKAGLSHSYMENRKYWELINSRPKVVAKKRKLALNRTSELSFESKPCFEPGKREAEGKAEQAGLKRSSTMIDIVERELELEGKRELDFVHRRVSQQINTVKAEIHVKIASYVKNARLSYLQAKGLRGRTLIY